MARAFIVDERVWESFSERIRTSTRFREVVARASGQLVELGPLGALAATSV